jgi:hypothetical protein
MSMNVDDLWKIRRKIKRAQPGANLRLQTIVKAAARGSDGHALHMRQRQYFLSPDAKIWAATRAVGKLAERQPALVLDIAQGINMFAPCDETVARRYKRKISGGVRPIYEFGLLQKAHQILAQDVLNASAKLPPWQYQNTGMGRN